MSVYKLRTLDKIEIFTLLDNYTDLTVMDNSDVITRGGYPPHGGTKQPLVAEHGFSLFIRTFRNNETRSMVFDGGFTPSGAVQNARRLGLDLKETESFVLSHGHADHWGGLKGLVKATKRTGMPLVAHPDIFRHHRYSVNKSIIYRMPQLTKRYISTSGFDLRETREPYPMLQDNVLFLGEVPRLNDFEKSEANSFYLEKGLVKQDDFADDSSIAMLLQGRGLVVIAGCAHAGIINTIHQAMKLTGENRIFAVMGGFHLTGKTKAQLAPLLKSLQQCHPRYVIPCHCTGRKASQWIEETMSEAFLLNLSGTKLTFRGCEEKSH
ncbi:MAG: MBL fold metallo-hydrolase [Syntrophaceae bacterium]|nr:MBL fold metallo-hydrolase [Syntrophaceae bacterium]